MFYKILELYSGIGGMHCAWNGKWYFCYIKFTYIFFYVKVLLWLNVTFSESNLPGEIIAAVDINTVANEVYAHNFPQTNLLNRNIQSLTIKEIKKLNVNTILMSPPCQPFTRNGKYLDENDSRSNSFQYLISILDKLENIDYILMENVKGFECSFVRDLFIDKLKECKFIYQEFLLSPSSVGVPNSRLRYYCIARRNLNWNLKIKDGTVSISILAYYIAYHMCIDGK